ncbi:MAG: dihydrolipoyl dehydrogenase, partial [Candidatus Heimdallarchaeota archaeon]
MKDYDIIAIGTGSSMNIIPALLNSNPELKIAVIDKDEPGGICLTKGCIPTKILLYPAEIIRNIQKAKNFGIDVEIKKIDFKYVMERMRSLIYHDINNIQQGLSQATEFDYYQEIAEFIDEYTLKVGKETIKGKIILLCTGSKPK